jgi:hypothetical protein
MSLTLLPPTPNDFRAAIEQVKRHLEDHLEFIKLDAKLRRAKYDAYIEVGFTPEQALLLIRG